jgi:hypothetical protein
MLEISDNFVYLNTKNHRVPPIQNPVIVLGVEFQAFISPIENRLVFSQSGAARGLKIDEKTVRRIFGSKKFNALQGMDLMRGKLYTTENSNPISVVTQGDLALLVKICAEKAFPTAKAMHDASFAMLLQESVDIALGIARPRENYITRGVELRRQLEQQYLASYHSMKTITLNHGHGVRALCEVNKQVSNLSVSDADSRRMHDAHWRKNSCSSFEKTKFTIGNAVHEKAVEASSKLNLKQNLKIAANRTGQIFNLLDAPF